MINYEQILKDTTAIVKSLVSGAYANGNEPNIANLINETYDALKAIAERAEKDEIGTPPSTDDDIDF